MKTVPLFDTGIGQFFTERQSRNIRAGKALFQLVTKAGKGLNPAAVWMDAAIAVSDCIGAYLRYKQAKEITAQLEYQKEALDIQIENCRKMLCEEQQLWQEEQQLRLKKLDDALRRDNQASQRILKEIRSHRKTLDLLLTQLTDLRKQSLTRPPELTALVNSVDKLMQAQLACLVVAFEPSNR